MNNNAYHNLVALLNQKIHPLTAKPDRFNKLLEQINNARFVLIGEASHGTHEFYQARAEITKLLIEQNGFMAVAIEGDWPDAYLVHRYLQGLGVKDAIAALDDFKRFPTWMWRNYTLLPFLEWLRQYNDKIANAKVGFYGLDLYSMHSSMEAVIKYLSQVDREGAARARARYACFNHTKVDPQTYGYLTSLRIKESCMQEAIAQLMEMQHHASEYIQKNNSDEEEYFFATQNARLVKNAENYYRSMFESHILSWNVRDQHMAETLNILANYLENRFARPAKIIVWAHNSHIGDARATEMGERGEINIGQLTREQHDQDAFLLGFSTYHGTVTAASEWGGPAECKIVNPGLAGSCEDLFHTLKDKNFLLNLHNNNHLESYLKIPRLQRAIGVIYQPETERESHYFFTRLPYQFDAVIHFDRSTAVQPIDVTPTWRQPAITGAEK